MTANPGTETTKSTGTNPCGRSFLSYRRSASGDAEALIVAQNDRGVPTWRDTDSLESEPTLDALIRQLESPETANAVLWLTPDIGESDAIQRIEAPRILKRARRDDGFFVEARLAGGLDHAQADRVIARVPTLDSLSGGWNLSKVPSPLGATDARNVAVAVLRRRLRAVDAALEREAPLRLALHTRADAPLGFLPDVPLQLDWCRHFQGRCATAESWEQNLGPALGDIVAAIQEIAPTRVIEASGRCCLPAAFALGRAFIEPSGLRLVWRQHTSGVDTSWSLNDEPEDSGFTSSVEHTRFDSTDLAVLVNVRGDVEPAVHASKATVPRFGAVLRIAPSDGLYPGRIETPGQAVHLARLVADEIRGARTAAPHLERAHVFLSGPVGLAVLVGQQLNGLGLVQTYEHIQAEGHGRYVPAALLTDRLSRGQHS